jgi:hypothetical protein
MTYARDEIVMRCSYCSRVFTSHEAADSHVLIEHHIGVNCFQIDCRNVATTKLPEGWFCAHHALEVIGL